MVRSLVSKPRHYVLPILEFCLGIPRDTRDSLRATNSQLTAGLTAQEVLQSGQYKIRKMGKCGKFD